MIAQLKTECEKVLKSTIAEIEHMSVTDPRGTYGLTIQGFQRLNTELLELMLKLCKYNELGISQSKVIEQIVKGYLQQYRRKYFQGDLL